MRESGQGVSRAVFEENFADKLGDEVFRADMTPLLRQDVAWNLDEAARVVGERLIAKLPGEAWKGRASSAGVGIGGA